MTRNFYRIILICFLFLDIYSLTLCAQQLPNSGFETFETGYNGVGEQPIGWKGSNITQWGVSATLVSSDANGRSGNCVRIHNEFVGIGKLGAPSPAYIALGTPWFYAPSVFEIASITGGTEGGMRFQFRPDTLALWVKRSYILQETAHALVYLWAGESIGTAYQNQSGTCSEVTHIDDESDVRGKNSCTTSRPATLIGEGEWKSSEQFDQWTLVKAPITYYNNVIPEKMNVIISAANYPGSNESMRVGSVLYADDVQFIYSSKVSDMRINNRSIADFNGDVYNYTHILGKKERTIPPITCFRSGRQLSDSEVAIVYGDLSGTPTTITVTAEDGRSTTTYTIRFVNQLSTNAHPAFITLDDEPLDDFNGYVTSYNVNFPAETTQCPEIRVIPSESTQKWSITTPCTGMPGSAVVTVIAEDTLVRKSYTINYFIEVSTDSATTSTRLTDILIDNISLSDFEPDRRVYKITYPIGTQVSSLPVAAQFRVDAAAEQTVDIIQADEQTVVIYVTAADGQTMSAYVVEFEILLSNNAYLSSIVVNNVPLADFDPQIFEYTCLLPFGASSVPSLGYVKGEDSQTVDIIQGFVNDISYIYVTAEDGTEQVYQLFFRVWEENPGDIPTPDDVCFELVGDNVWKASTSRNNVSIGIFSITGEQKMQIWSVPRTNPNESLCDPSSTGIRFVFDKRKDIYVYLFIYNGKRKILAGKFAY
ncbi:MAG: hypothetical protein LBS16_06385 [Prevotellaceae bacterium]|jgi:hypothetical protein|nr:hypothetical protein [Prevotellaceae bacterium]